MRRLALLLCLTAALAACGSDGSSKGPVALPPVSPSVAASSVAPTPSAVAKPPEADAFTSEGAAAFVRYYIAIINEALRTNDATQLQRLSSGECGGCRKYIESVQTAAMQGAAVATRGLSVRSAVAPGILQGETTVLLDFDADAFVATDAQGAVVAKGAAAAGLSAELRCIRSGQGWIVQGFRLIGSSS